MADYAATVSKAAAAFPEPPLLVGWSMGGLVALMAAGLSRVRAVVVLEPSAPSEVIGLTPDQELREGILRPDFYGVVRGSPVPAGLTVAEWDWVLRQSSGARESGYARDERTRGISVGPVRVPLLVVHGDVESFSEQRGPDLARALGGHALRIAGASHWALVVGERCRQQVREGIWAWVEETLG